jgi:phosphoglucosamine mutase
VLAIMKKTGKMLSELVAGMRKYPQTMINVRTERRLGLELSSEIQAAVVTAEAELVDTGRVVLRASGTESVIRVMVEGEDNDQVVAIAKRLAAVVGDSAT